MTMNESFSETIPEPLDIPDFSDPGFLHTVTQNELLDKPLREEPDLIQGFLVSGVTLLVGAPKVGKSFLVLQIAYHISTGKPLWDFPIQQAEVLYLALEDTERRLQKRSFRMFGEAGTDFLHFAVVAKTINCGLLDQLQYEYDVLFIVAGTNNKNEDDTYPPIGSPADSLNAITVNCSDFGNKAVHYARRGPVLRFFNKPDVSTFGGVREDRIQVYGPRGFRKVYGTSYAAPWITRKAAYLMHVMNLTKEAAKALIIDAAAGWNTDISNITLLGYGNVPRRIEDIINTQDDEIRFFINSTSIDYDTYTSNIPVPCTKKGFPFRFRVTMCYTPRCHRNQGVDYTDTDLDIHFGRYKGTRMSSINNNEQGEPVCLNLPEGKARSQFRKWDNVKRVCEGLIDNPRHKQLSTDNSLFWGMSIKAVERLDDKPGRGMPFCAVVTMKSIDNVNRYGQFKQLCATSHIWNVIPLDQKVMVETYHVSEEEAVFEN